MINRFFSGRSSGDRWLAKLGCTLVFTAVTAASTSVIPTSSSIAQTQSTTAANTAALAPGHYSNTDDQRSLPSILTISDRQLYRQIFDLQRDGDWEAADRLIDQLSSKELLGHVLFQRYMHPTKYRSQYLELRDWMAEYADHPGASRIYNLALRRKPSNYRNPAPPEDVELPDLDVVLDGQMTFLDSGENLSTSSQTGRSSRKYEGRSSAQRRQIRAEQRQIRRMVQRGNVTNALERLSTRANRRLFDDVSYAESLGVIARGYFRYHYDEKALNVAATAEEIAGDDAAVAHWWGGLAAFRQENWSLAAQHFDALSLSVEADSWLKAAGGFWASRAYLRAGRPEMNSPMIERAAQYPRTFYGLMATEALGLAPPLDFSVPSLSDNQTELLYRLPVIRRAIALTEAGQADLADAELRRFVAAVPPGFQAMMMSLADQAGLADVAFRLGRDIQRQSGQILDGALYPLPGWVPSGGFSVDRALVYAIVRQESQFRPRAVSRAGARGLMQLMPATAGYMAGTSFRGSARAELFDPDLNLSLGQKYIAHVLGHRGIEGNLLYMLAAYNAGPGNLLNWRDRIDYADDPLLFIESLPSRETRNYIEHVLSNFWIYRIRLNQPVESLHTLIGGTWPSYVALDGSEDVSASQASFTTE